MTIVSNSPRDLVGRRCGFVGNLFHVPKRASSQDNNASASAIKTYYGKVGPAALSGIMFAAGLYNSGMIYASKVFDSWMFPPFHLVTGDHPRLCHGWSGDQLDLLPIC
jgi:hypothetical protein